MKYLVTYVQYGDTQSDTFDHEQDALDFIAENVNDINYGDFNLYTKIEIAFAVSVTD